MRITKVETVPLHLPVRAPLVESGGTFDQFFHVLVRIHADDGGYGLGEVEAYPSFERLGVETPEGIVAVIRDYLAPCLIGQDPFRIGQIWKSMDRAVTGYWRVKAGLDIALHDLQGRHLGLPVHALLGGKVRDSYIVEGIGYGISIGEPSEVAAIAERAAAEGYRQLELKAGDPDPSMDVERLSRVRAAIGPEIPIKMDFNGYYDPKTAVQLIRRLEPLSLQWVEQPAKYWDLDGLAFVRRSVGVKTVIDETVETPEDMMRAARAGAADCVHVKPTIKGGFTLCRQIAVIARAAGIEVVPGSSAPTGVGHAAAQAFISVTPEISGGTHGSPLDMLEDDVVTQPVPQNSTSVIISDLPGLGIELDERKVEQYRVR